MTNKLTIMDTKKMTETEIALELCNRIEELKKLGMDSVSAGAFVSSVMNLGIAAQERKMLNKNDE